MTDTSRSLRRPGLVVYLSGLGTSILALWVVELLNRNQINVMGFYVNGILPIGALIIGVGSGIGYAVASRVLQIKLFGVFIATMVVTALVDYMAAQYVTYSNLLEQHRLMAEQYPFTQYLRDICEKMSFRSRGGDRPGSELGIFGYLFKLLEMAGYVLGATLPSLFVSGLPYCKACQKYLKKHRTAYFSSPTPWSEVKKLAKKERESALQSAIAPLLERTNELGHAMATAPLSDVVGRLEDLDAKPESGTAAHVQVVVEKCPTCEAHVVRFNLVNYNVDKQVINSPIRVLDKIEPIAGGTDEGREVS
jgi:hypothetical protein